MDIKKISLNEISPHIRLADLVTTTGKQFYVPLRMIYDYEFYYIVEGEIIVKTEGTQVVLGPGDIHFMRPFNWHKRYSNSPKLKYYGIHFDFLKIANNPEISTYDEYVVPINLHKTYISENSNLKNREVYEPIELNLPLKLKVSEPSKYIVLLNNIVNHFRMGTVSHQMFTKADFLTLIGYLVQESANLTEFTKAYKHNAVAQFTQTLTDDLTDKIYLSDLALQTGMSPAHMRKLFHKVNNVSPREYLINTRIEKAKFLLEEGKMSISEIGREIGYPNVNYFSRIFKSKTKMSPTDYRKSLYEEKENDLDPKFYWCDLATKGREQESSSKKNDKKSEK